MKFLASLLTLLAFAGVVVAEEKPAAADTAIRNVLSDQVTAWNKGDLAEFMVGYWNSPELTFYSGKDKHQGWDKAFERYKKRYQAEGKEMGQLGFSELEVQLLSPDFALVKGRWKVVTKAETFEGLFSLVMKNTDKGWRIVHDHTSGS